jgi:phosphatidylethanolamine/phosphatidyl-N-methylethanolamine N-methyltransferase
MADSSVAKRRPRGDGPRRRRSRPSFFSKLKPRVEERMRFLGGFLRGPTSVGALGPSSSFLAEAMIRGFGLQASDTVVELGPGTGAFTGRILSKIGSKTTFFVLELDPIFAAGLRNQFPGLTVYNDSAERMVDYLARHGKKRADYIICGLPWASLPLEVQDRVLEAVLGSLAPGGIFTTFGYVHARWMPNALRFRQRLRNRFAHVETSPVVWKNIPPAFVYRCSLEAPASR